MEAEKKLGLYQLELHERDPPGVVTDGINPSIHRPRGAGGNRRLGEVDLLGRCIVFNHGAAVVVLHTEVTSAGPLADGMGESSADDHQRLNVAELAAMDAAVVVDNSEIDGESLETMIISLLEDSAIRKKMSSKLRSWSTADADVEAAKKIADVVRHGKMELARSDGVNQRSEGHRESLTEGFTG